jgi:hypothetical protein
MLADVRTAGLHKPDRPNNFGNYYRVPLFRIADSMINRMSVWTQ